MCARLLKHYIRHLNRKNFNTKKREFVHAGNVNWLIICQCNAAIMDFASSFWFSSILYFLWVGNAKKSMRRGMTNALTLAVKDLKDSTSFNPSKKRKMAKKTCLTLGSAWNRKRCFRSCEPEWPATSSQWSVQGWWVSVCMCSLSMKKRGHKGKRQHTSTRAWNLAHFVCVCVCVCVCEKGVKYSLTELWPQPCVNTDIQTGRKLLHSNVHVKI